MLTEEELIGKAVEECRAAIVPPALKVKAGHAVEIQLVLKNEGKTEIKFPRVSLWFDYQYALQDESKQQVPLTRFGEQAKRALAAGGAVALNVIAPGKELVISVLINRLYDMTLAGRYVLEASKDLPNRRGDGFVKVVSNRCIIDVVDEA